MEGDCSAQVASLGHELRAEGPGAPGAGVDPPLPQVISREVVIVPPVNHWENQIRLVHVSDVVNFEPRGASHEDRPVIPESTSDLAELELRPPAAQRCAGRIVVGMLGVGPLVAAGR